MDLLSTNIDCDASKGGKVSLKFRHSLTAVVVKTGDDMLPGKVTEVTLSGIYDRGTHSIGTDKWTIDEKTAVKETFTVKSDKTLDASGSGSKPGNTKPGEEIVGGDLTFFMVPQTLGSDAKLTIKFTDKASGADRSSDLTHGVTHRSDLESRHTSGIFPQHHRNQSGAHSKFRFCDSTSHQVHKRGGD